MGKSFTCAAAALAAVFGFVVPTFADDKKDQPIEVPVLAAGSKPVEINVLGLEVELTGSSASTDRWLLKVCVKLFKDLTGKDLPEDVRNSPAKIWKEFKKEKAAEENGTGPQGSVVFFKDRLAISNGDGTLIGAGANGETDVRMGVGRLGTPLGYAAKAVAGGAAGGGAGGGGAVANGGGAAGGAAGGQGAGAGTVQSEPYKANESELEVLARIVKGEWPASGGQEGAIAVAAVVIHRARDGSFPGGKSIIGVAHAPYQFSCYNSDQRARLYDGPIPQYAMDAAKAALKGTDPVPHATYYFNPTIVKPSWAASLTFVRKIGSGTTVHTFYKK